MKPLVRVLAGIAVMAAVGAASFQLWWPTLLDIVIARAAQDRTDHSYIDPEAPMRVLLCGTGTPQSAIDRGQACTLVAAAGMLLLFDAGEGAAPRLAAMNVPMNKIDSILLTHLHSDHFNGLGSLLSYTWGWGRDQKATVYGPAGVAGLVAGMNQMYRHDIAYRADHMPFNLIELATADTREIPTPPAGQFVRVLSANGVTVDAVLVAHEPVEPALGYVVRYRGKKVFISGDTRVSESYAFAMANADLVVHEAMATHLLNHALPKLTAAGREHAAKVAGKVRDYHADTLELASLAQAQHVKRLVLTHLIPAPENFVHEWIFTLGMRDRFKGDLVIGYDGLVLTVD